MVADDDDDDINEAELNFESSLSTTTQSDLAVCYILNQAKINK